MWNIFFTFLPPDAKPTPVCLKQRTSLVDVADITQKDLTFLREPDAC